MSNALVSVASKELTIFDGGTNHGGRELIPHVARLQRESDVLNVKVVGVDPVPGRANRFITQAAQFGLRGEAREAKIEDVINDGIPEGAPVILNMDTPGAHAMALYQLADRKIAVLGALYAASPIDGQLHGFRYVCAADEHEEKREVAGMFRSLAAFAARGGRERVWGTQGRPEHLPLEPVYRDWTGRFVHENLAKLAVGLSSINHYVEMTRDGNHTLPIIIRDSSGEWASPFALATAVLGNPPTPILGGDDFVIAELGPNGVRFHFARLGKTDGRVRVNGYAGFDHETLDAAERAERERQLAHEQSLQRADRARQEREVMEAVRRAEQQTVTRRRPFFFTD
ncbi:MAG: hypothetical protein JO197_15640 [Acidobacteria bacterium]|nr:hypothetical protein [Acidobacteriota bacterium]MBV9475044.1 hypothetical protein [Acidobacteriota bacterium]